MKSAARILGLVTFLLGVGWAVYVSGAPEPPPLAGLIPRGAILYLEAKDFQSLLSDWSASPEKQQWLKSADRSVFSHSALFLRLEKAQEQFTAAAGIPPDMKFLAEAAGQESALGLYDIGKLEFLYVTRLPSSRATQSALWEARTKFESRSAAGVTFFVHTDAESGRTVAFAVTGDYLLLATREDLVASALSLISGGAGEPIAGEQWFSKAIAAASSASHQPGDLRIVLNLEKIAATPHFRTYWIQRNVSELKEFSAGVSDLYRTASEYREERVLLRSSAPTASAADTSGKPPRAVTAEGAQAAGSVARLVPEDAGVYRAIANPTVDESLALLETKILAPHLSLAPAEKLAPGVTLGEGVTGNAADLETRIDQPPAEHVALKGSTDALRVALEKAGLTAALSIESSRTPPSSAFVTLHSVLVFRASADWDGDAVRAALVSAIEPALSTAALGVGWRPMASPEGGPQSGKAKEATFALDGLMPLQVAALGSYLFVSDDADLLAAARARFSLRADAQAAVYLAGFNHARERGAFARLTRTLDRSEAAGVSTGAAGVSIDADAQAEPAAAVAQMAFPSGGPQDAREPFFFSENLSSLSRSLSRVQSVSVSVRDSGGAVVQTVIYHWAR